MDKIEGVPEGWRLVRIGRPKVGEHYIEISGSMYEATPTTPTVLHFVLPIVEKIEQPKKYRPFANAAEFEPHRDRWVRVKANGMVTRPISYTHDRLYIGDIWLYWGDAFLNLEFETGTPFGVEVA